FGRSRPAATSLQEVEARRGRHGLGAVADLEPVQQHLDVALDRALAEMQPRGNHSIRVPGRDQLNDLPLPRGQVDSRLTAVRTDGWRSGDLDLVVSPGQDVENADEDCRGEPDG